LNEAQSIAIAAGRVFAKVSDFGRHGR
jgi:hypothetical protein